VSFSIASYNILAEAYIRRASFPHTAEAILDPSSRLPAVVEAVAALGADAVCLQEVEPQALEALRARLEPAGYAAHYAPKAGGKPDGCATLVRRAVLRPVGMTRLHFHDEKGGDQQSGHVALILTLEHAGGRLAVVNTHLKWDLPERRGEAHVGYQQMAELLRLRAEFAPGVRAWILCGDLNVEPDSEVIDLCHQQGLRCAYPDTELCRREGISTVIYYRWSKAFLDGGTNGLTRDTNRDATVPEVRHLKGENADLKWALAESVLEIQRLEKTLGL